MINNKNQEIHDPQEHMKKHNLEWDMFQYGYMFTMEDKIYSSQIHDENIKALCLQEQKEKFNFNLAGDIQGEYHISNQDTIHAVTEELKHHIKHCMRSEIKHISLLSNRKTNADDLWVNYQKKNEFNPSHVHSGLFSFVIYASIPEEIRQEHKNSYSSNSKTRGLIQFTSNRTNGVMYFNPRENDILIFRSDHVHQVYPFYSDNTRITIAGNVNFVELENGETLDYNNKE